MNVAANVVLETKGASSMQSLHETKSPSRPCIVKILTQTRRASCCSFLALLILSTHALADTKPAWVLSLDRPLRWFQPAPSGVLLVGTEQEILGVGVDNGTVRWRLGPAEDSKGGDVEALAPLPYALVSLGKRRAPNFPATFLIDVRDGHTIWAADSLGVGWSIGSWLLPGNDRLLLRAALKPKGKVQTAILVDVRTGNRIWTRQELGENFDPEPVVAARICGYERPLLDTDSTMILFSDSKTLRKYDLGTGALLWQSTDLPPPAAGLLERLGDATEVGKNEAGKNEEKAKGEEAERAIVNVWCAPMVVATSGDRFYAPYLNTVSSFSTKNGQRLWKKIPKLTGVVVQMQEIQSGLLVRTLSNEDSPSFKVELLDRESGKRRWRVPGKGSGLLTKLAGTWSSTSNFLIDGNRMLIASEGDLVSVDLTGGEDRSLGKLGFESGDDPITLGRVPEGVCVIGKQNLGIYATDDGRRIRKFYRDAPGGEGLGLALLGVSALTYGAGFFEGGSVRVSAHGDHLDRTTEKWSVKLAPEVGFNELMKDYTATRARDNYSFFLIDLKDGDDIKPGIVRVNRQTGEVEGEAVLGTKKPDYIIDSYGQVIFSPDSKTLHCYRF